MHKHLGTFGIDEAEFGKRSRQMPTLELVVPIICARNSGLILAEPSTHRQSWTLSSATELGAGAIGATLCHGWSIRITWNLAFSGVSSTFRI